MQILTISKKDSRPEVAITVFLAIKGVTKISITPTALPLFDLDDCDCVIYIDPLPDFRVVYELQKSNCPSILVADQDFDNSHCFIQFGVLDRSNSVSIGIKTIRDYLDSIPLKADRTIFSTSILKSIEDIDRSPDLHTCQYSPTIHQIQQARDDFNFFEALATG